MELKVYCLKHFTTPFYSMTFVLFVSNFHTIKKKFVTLKFFLIFEIYISEICCAN